MQYFNPVPLLREYDLPKLPILFNAVKTNSSILAENYILSLVVDLVLVGIVYGLLDNIIEGQAFRRRKEARARRVPSAPHYFYKFAFLFHSMLPQVLVF